MLCIMHMCTFDACVCGGYVNFRLAHIISNESFSKIFQHGVFFLGLYFCVRCHRHLPTRTILVVSHSYFFLVCLWLRVDYFKYLHTHAAHKFLTNFYDICDRRCFTIEFLLKFIFLAVTLFIDIFFCQRIVLPKSKATA